MTDQKILKQLNRGDQKSLENRKILYQLNLNQKSLDEATTKYKRQNNGALAHGARSKSMREPSPKQQRHGKRSNEREPSRRISMKMLRDSNKLMTLSDPSELINGNIDQVRHEKQTATFQAHEPICEETLQAENYKKVKNDTIRVPLLHTRQAHHISLADWPNSDETATDNNSHNNNTDLHSNKTENRSTELLDVIPGSCRVAHPMLKSLSVGCYDSKSRTFEDHKNESDTELHSRSFIDNNNNNNNNNNNYNINNDDSGSCQGKESGV